MIAHVFADDEYDDVLDRLGFDEADGIDPSEVAARHSTSREIAQALEAGGVHHEIRGDEVGSLAAEIAADRIIVGGRRCSPAGKAVFGSTVQEILLSAPCPVTFVRD